MSDNEKQMRGKTLFLHVLKQILSLFFCLMVAYGTARFVTDFFLQPIRVEGVSMENTLYHNDVLLINKIKYRIHDPERFDMVIFPYSMNEYYVKRIIGLPGETIQIKDGSIYINEKPLLEEYGREVIQDAGLATNAITLDKDEYFLMGDNRNQSTDSRSQLIGPVKKDKLEGRVFARIYPFAQMRWF